MSSSHITEGLHVKEAQPGLPQKGITIPELEIRENARWMALLIDTEGAIGWTLATQRLGRVKEEYRYVYRYAIPYVTIGMSELESKRTVDEAARLIGTRVRTRIMRPNFLPVREITETRGRALAVITLTKPYLDKFSRMATLIATLFNHHKYRTHIPAEEFGKSVITLFGKPVTPEEANGVMLRMTETEFNKLISKATKLF